MAVRITVNATERIRPGVDRDPAMAVGAGTSGFTEFKPLNAKSCGHETDGTPQGNDRLTMYAVDSVLPTATVPPGTTLLVTGTDGDECTELADRLLAAGFDHGEPAVAVTTTATPPDVRRKFGTDDERDVAVVSAVAGDCEPDEYTRCVDSPGDFAGIGLSCSELVERLSDDGVRVTVDSVSDLLDAADANTVFRFLHVLTGRITTAEGFGVATIQLDRHEEKTCHTIGQLFDARVEVRRRSGQRELRVRGLEDVREEWKPF